MFLNLIIALKPTLLLMFLKLCISYFPQVIEEKNCVNINSFMTEDVII